jgi:methanogenic corrinoid protein MtbC1
MEEELTAALCQGIADLDEDRVLAAVRSGIQAGGDPAAIIAACEEGMRLVGDLYQEGEYYLSGLIMAGEILREVLEIVQPALEATFARNASGRVLLGTVQGDIHDIGKAIVQIALRANGFSVKDLGVDVPPQTFADEALAWQPDVVGLSGLLTTAYEPMRETVRLLRGQPEFAASPIPVIIGGGTLNEQVRVFVGANYWCNDALEGIRLCQQIMMARDTGYPATNQGSASG